MSNIKLLFVKLLALNDEKYIFTCFLNKTDTLCHGTLENLVLRKVDTMIDSILPINLTLEEDFSSNILEKVLFICLLFFLHFL